VKRGHETLSSTADRIVFIVNQHYAHARLLFWGGLLLLAALVLVRLVGGRSDIRRIAGDPLVLIVGASLAALAAFSLSDFQGYPDLYPLLPYAALGIAGAVAAAERLHGAREPRYAATAVALIGCAALAGLTWHWYSSAHDKARPLVAERRDARKLERILAPGETLYALGDPTPLVLTGRRNPSRYIYLGSGVGEWSVRHSPTQIEGWRARISSIDPEIVLVNQWSTHIADLTKAWLASVYGGGVRLGNWLLFVKPAVRARAASQGIVLRPAPRFR
jgi:hypothetical protein